MERPYENEAAATAHNPFESAFDDEFAVHSRESSLYSFSMEDIERDYAETRSSPMPRTSMPPNAQAESKHSSAQPSRPPVRSSIVKNPLTGDSFRGPLPNRPARAAIVSRPPQPTDLSRRSSSRASSYAPFESSGTPSLNGPSHPYGMYPQTSVPRSPSVTTTSTRRHASSISTSATRPAHPYALYQQNGLPMSDDDSPVPQVPTILVGFPGRNANFHRQLGPDGEEQDIIGPDGHTEQLPPYSKYPNGNESATAALASRTPSHESERVLVPSAEPPPQTSQNHTEYAPSEMAGSSTTTPPSEKSWKERNSKERWKTGALCCSLPRWLLVIAFVCLVFVGVVIGGAIGVFLAKEKHKQASDAANTNGESTLDASAIPTPTGLPPLRVGQFLLPIGSPDETAQSCLTDSSQTEAWSCSVPPTSLIITTDTQSGGFSTARISPQSPSPGGQTYQYGAQPPTVPAEKLSFVVDLSDPQRGPALHFQTVYDKLVILDPASLSSTRKRQARAFPDYPAPASINSSPAPSPSAQGYGYGKSAVKSGEQPWFCFWNSTSIEGFIYVTQRSNNSSSATTTTTAAAANGITGSTPSSSQPHAPSSSIGPTISTVVATSIGANPLTSTLLTSTVVTGTVVTNTLHTDTPRPDTTTTDGKAEETTTNHGGKTRTKRDYDKAVNNLLEFPYVVKLSERRLPNPPVHAYCQKMNANNDGSVTPVLGENDNPIIITLQETDPSESQFASAAISPVPTSAATSTPTSHAGNNGFIAERDVEAAAEVEERDWDMMERSIEERIAEAAVEEWERSYLGKRGDPAQSCACQWLVV